MSEILTSLLAFIVALSLLVAIHEYGHFWVARRLGVRVLRFCIGFGKPVWSRIAGRDPVEYAVAAIPLGGYVKLLDEREGPVPADQLHRAFNRQTPARRIAILLAGPAFNFLFAIVAYWLMYVTGVTALKPVIGAVAPESYAAAAGLRAEDEVLAVAGRTTATVMDAQLALIDELVSTGRTDVTVRDVDGRVRTVRLAVEGDRRPLSEPGDLFERLGMALWEPVLPALLGDLDPEGTASAAGLRPGDLIVAADGEPVDDWSTWVDYVRARPGATVTVDVVRDGATLPLELAIAAVSVDGEQIGRIGAGVRVPDGLYDRVLTRQRYGPIAALGEAAARTGQMSGLTVRMLYRMITGDVSPKNISGPINIAQVAGYTASAGLAPFLRFLAIVSISLGILNLLPIPMLDGGQIAYQLAEIAKGSPVSERAQMIGQQVGILLLLLLMSFAFYNDISRLSG
jgi:regulator of sigma E protease